MGKDWHHGQTEGPNRVLHPRGHWRTPGSNCTFLRELFEKTRLFYGKNGLAFWFERGVILKIRPCQCRTSSCSRPTWRGRCDTSTNRSCRRPNFHRRPRTIPWTHQPILMATVSKKPDHLMHFCNGKQSSFFGSVNIIRLKKLSPGFWRVWCWQALPLGRRRSAMGTTSGRSRVPRTGRSSSSGSTCPPPCGRNPSWSGCC